MKNWHLYPNEIPEREKVYQITINRPNDIYTTIGLWSKIDRGFHKLSPLPKVLGKFDDNEVSAWCELKKPYGT